VKENVRTYEDAIEGIERVQQRLKARRESATGAVLEHINRSIGLNDRTLRALNGALATAKKQLRRA
jgi:hypothetical protein